MAYVQYEIEIKKNGSGYNDPTAYEALKNIIQMEGKTMEFYRGDIVEIETKNGNLKEAVVLQTHDKYSNILILTDDDRMPYSVNCRGERYANPGMVQYVFNDHVTGFIRSMTDSEYESIMNAVIDSLGYYPQQSVGSEEPDPERENDEIKYLQKVIEKERKDADLLKKELAQVQTERTVYKDLYTDILDRVMKGA